MEQTTNERPSSPSNVVAENLVEETVLQESPTNKPLESPHLFGAAPLFASGCERVTMENVDNIFLKFGCKRIGS